MPEDFEGPEGPEDGLKGFGDLMGKLGEQLKKAQEIATEVRNFLMTSPSFDEMDKFLKDKDEQFKFTFTLTLFFSYKSRAMTWYHRNRSSTPKLTVEEFVSFMLSEPSIEEVIIQFDLLHIDDQVIFLKLMYRGYPAIYSKLCENNSMPVTIVRAYSSLSDQFDDSW